MENLHIIMTAVTAIILFVFGLDNFSKEIEKISGERFRKTIGKATTIPLVGVLIGALVTAFIQSSSATSVIAISLVNAGVLSFKNSIGIIFGSNIGTTITAQLVAFKLTAFAPIFIIIGFLLSIVRSRFSIFGKTIFYFGFVFFSLNLISSTLAPLQNNEWLVNLLTQPQSPLLAILFGCIFTAVVQSSSVTTGLAIIFTQQGVLGLENAVPLIMGANIGTSITALVAALQMDISAKKAALSHFLFNFGGVVLFVPLLFVFSGKLSSLKMEPALALANIHLLFNLATSLIFIVFIGPFARLIDYVLGEGKMDFGRLSLPVYKQDEAFEDVKVLLDEHRDRLFCFLQENYSAVTLSIETNYQSIHDGAQKRIEYVDFIKKEYTKYFSQIGNNITDEAQSQELIKSINQFDYLFQIHDSIYDLYDTKNTMDENFIELKSDVLIMLRALSSNTLNLFRHIDKSRFNDKDAKVAQASRELQEKINCIHRDLLGLLTIPNRKDTGMLTKFMTYSQRLKDKLVNYQKAKNVKETKELTASPGLLTQQ